MFDALVRAGYAATSAATQKISTHPLVRRTGPDRCRIVGVP